MSTEATSSHKRVALVCTNLTITTSAGLFDLENED